jgi:ribosomal protein S18 acetylase RimI-like enzyme
MIIRPINPKDRAWLVDTIAGAFGSVRLVSNDHVIDDASTLDGFAAEVDGRPVGCALLNDIGGDVELVALVSTYRGAGVGSAMLEAVVERGRRDGWTRLWLVTSNDNTEAIRMYQRAGWDWVDFRRDAITRARSVKPEIPDTGNHGIPIRHELEFEAPL